MISPVVHAQRRVHSETTAAGRKRDCVLRLSIKRHARESRGPFDGVVMMSRTVLYYCIRLCNRKPRGLFSVFFLFFFFFLFSRPCDANLLKLSISLLLQVGVVSNVRKLT